MNYKLLYWGPLGLSPIDQPTISTFPFNRYMLSSLVPYTLFPV